MLCFVGNGDQKKFTQNPRHFSMQHSQANTKKIIFTKCFWRAGEETTGTIIAFESKGFSRLIRIEFLPDSFTITFNIVGAVVAHNMSPQYLGRPAKILQSRKLEGVSQRG